MWLCLGGNCTQRPMRQGQDCLSFCPASPRKSGLVLSSLCWHPGLGERPRLHSYWVRTGARFPFSVPAFRSSQGGPEGDPLLVRSGSGAMNRSMGDRNTAVPTPPCQWREQETAPGRGRGAACRWGPELTRDTRPLKQ